MAAGADGPFVFHSPAGRRVAPEPPHELVDHSVEWLREWADERALDLGPDVNMPKWDGKSADYDSAVGWLLAAG